VNREAWLTELVVRLRPMFEGVGAPIPVETRIACGWPSRSATSSRRRRIGECWHEDCSADKSREVFISPTLADPVEVAGVVVHELVHASGQSGHGAGFGKVARKLGLTGAMAATTIGDELRPVLAALTDEIGPYPHAALTPVARDKKQTTRLLKVACQSCGYTARITAKWLAIAAPDCPNPECEVGGVMEQAE
jgi:hypothetical protein